MKATVEIPSDELRDAMRFTKCKTKREAIVKAIAQFNVGIDGGVAEIRRLAPHVPIER